MNKTKTARLYPENTKVQFFFLFLLWVFYSFKPEWTIPGFKFIAPVQTLIHLILLVYWVLYSKKQTDNQLTKYFFLFVILMIISSSLARNTGLPREIIISFLLLLIIYLVTITYANNGKRTFSLFSVFLLGNLFIAILGIKGGGSARGVAIFEDQNDLALAMNIIFPITIFLGIGEKEKIKKLFYFAISGIFLTTIVLSNSRGGFVGLIAVMLYIWFKLPINKVKSTIIVLFIVVGLMLLAPKSFWSEMSTIQQGTQGGTASARIYYWKIAIREFVDHPIIGVGVRNYGAWLPDYVKPDDTLNDGRPIPGITRTWGRVSHSLYFTLLAELGVIGLILFILILFNFYKEVRPITQLQLPKYYIQNNISTDEYLLIQKLEKCRSLGLGLIGGMIGFLVSGAFLSVLYYPQFWILCTLGVTLGNYSRKTIKDVTKHSGEYSNE